MLHGVACGDLAGHCTRDGDTVPASVHKRLPTAFRYARQRHSLAMVSPGLHAT
jgi:hypothetical protein